MDRIETMDEASVPEAVIPYWGGSAALWERKEKGVVAIRSQNHPEDFRSFMRDIGGDPTDRQYWLFPIADKDWVMALIAEWAQKSGGEDRLLGWFRIG